MNCPKCGWTCTRVIDSRDNDRKGAVYRRRKCAMCGYRYTTFELTPGQIIEVVREMAESTKDKIIQDVKYTDTMVGITDRKIMKYFEKDKG